ncbi:hypothetical protein N0V88_003952 [Collariella sp. IMI 366227]|nr:hypothetical protein N0V88_003952 [Collariella sp. IMI 366227]
MDYRGYSFPNDPNYPSYPPHLRPGAAGLNPRPPYKYNCSSSLCNASLSSDPGADIMPRWSTSTKKGSPRGGKSSRGSEANKLKKPLTNPRNQNPGIDVALRSLNHEVVASLRIYQTVLRTFEGLVQALQDWAEDYTLDTIWRNMVRDKLRDKREKEFFESVATRVLASRASVKDAIKASRGIKETWDDVYDIEQQVRTAKKAVLFCDGIISLAERAARERLACKQLVVELEEAKSLLSRKRHSWIYAKSRQAVTGRARDPSNTRERKMDELRDELPHLWQKPAYEVLLQRLEKLRVEPRVWGLQVSRADILKEQTITSHDRREIISFLSTIISSSLAWLNTDDEREVIWEEASKRMSERCGRTGMSA